jgi:hypothetical protein
MRGRGLLVALALAPALGAGGALADEPAQGPVPVSFEVVGTGQILLLVAEGTERPCDASSNRVLFRGHVAAGSETKLMATTGSVCFDHTYGAFRESQWAGATMRSVGYLGAHPGPQAVLHVRVSTDNP